MTTDLVTPSPDLRPGDYDCEGFYDEMFDADGRPRPRAELLAARLRSLPPGELPRRQKAADVAMLNMGITFNVYGHQSGTEKIWPFDLVPRIIESAEWARVEAGLKQRIYALNLFIDDLYHERRIVRDGVVPDWLIDSGKCLLGPCAGLKPPRGVWCHITGTDLVRDASGTIYVLEDNLRVPSGVSYMLEDRKMMMRLFPELFAHIPVRPVSDYPSRLAKSKVLFPPTSRHKMPWGSWRCWATNWSIVLRASCVAIMGAVLQRPRRSYPGRVNSFFS
mgnify:CR=1 FL=1